MPSADCTRLTATSVVRSVIAPINSSSGTERTVIPRGSWAANGNRTDVKSRSATSTSAPAGSALAASPTRLDTVAPIAMRSASTPMSRPKVARDRSTASS